MMRPALIAAALALSACAATQPRVMTPEPVDLLIMNGLVVDGTGAKPFKADVATLGNRIIFIGDAKRERRQYFPRQVINADGLVVAPGFIDPHTHADEELQSDAATERALAPWLFQGVTTVVLGNDGFGGFEVAHQAATYGQAGIGPNVAMLVGLGPVRSAVMGDEDRAASSDEVDQMSVLVARAMCEGAFGLSAGLYYAPQNFVASETVTKLAGIAARQGGYYDTHLRDEGDFSIGLLAAVDEALAIGRDAGLPVHLAHLKALGPAVWGQSADLIQRVEAAQAAGQKVSADQYPWAASGTRISSALLPKWAQDGGAEALQLRLSQAEERARMAEGINANIARRGGADRLLITASLGMAEVTQGLTLAQQAEAWGVVPAEAALRILDQGDARLASFNMSSDDIAAISRQPWVVTGSDGSTGHPRKYASFPKAYQDLVVDGDMTLAEFVARSSARTAQIVGLEKRGQLKEGMAADILIFDAKKFAPRATFEQPAILSSGVVHLVVNGQPLISHGELTGDLPGRALRHSPADPTACTPISGAEQ